MPEQSHISSAPQVSDYGLITSKKSREAAGISSFDYVDDYNSARMAQYNNDFNIWKTQWEAEYNSPAAQRARLEAAGLNPNFNSIDGTGNISAEASKGAVAGRIGSNRNARIGNVLEGVNTVLKLVGEGVDMYSKISGIPKNVSGYRQLLYDSMAGKEKGIKLDNALKIIQNNLSQQEYDWTNFLHGVNDNYLYEPDEKLAAFYESPAYQKFYVDLQNAMALGDLRGVELAYKQIMQSEDMANALYRHTLSMFPSEEDLKAAQAGLAGWTEETASKRWWAAFMFNFIKPFL